MHKKVMVMEIKEKYALGMTDEGEVLRFYVKPELKVGDRIYVLEEDLYQPEKKGTVFYLNPTFQRMAGVAAMLVLCITIGVTAIMGRPAYAKADFGPALELELDKDGKVLRAKSQDQSIPKAELDALKGKSIFDIQGDLLGMIGDSGLLLTFRSPDNSREQKDFADRMKKTYPKQSMEPVKDPAGSNGAEQPSGGKPQNTVQPNNTSVQDGGGQHQMVEEEKERQEELAEEEKERQEELTEKEKERQEEQAEKEKEYQEEQVEKERERQQELEEEEKERQEEQMEEAEEQWEEAQEETHEQNEKAEQEEADSKHE